MALSADQDPQHALVDWMAARTTVFAPGGTVGRYGGFSAAALSIRGRHA
jgi:hypothetical protein